MSLRVSGHCLWSVKIGRCGQFGVGGNKVSGCPVIVNTSFNVRGEPIICTPEDAFRCFMGTELDYLVVGNHFLRKIDQKVEIIQVYKEKYELD